MLCNIYIDCTTRHAGSAQRQTLPSNLRVGQSPSLVHERDRRPPALRRLDRRGCLYPPLLALLALRSAVRRGVLRCSLHTRAAPRMQCHKASEGHALPPLVGRRARVPRPPLLSQNSGEWAPSGIDPMATHAQPASRPHGYRSLQSYAGSVPPYVPGPVIPGTRVRYPGKTA